MTLLATLQDWDRAVRSRNNTRKQNARIAAVLPSALDIIALVLQAGLDFQVALDYYLRYAPAGPLYDEWQRTARDLQLGRSRHQALRGLRERTSEPGLRETARMLLQGIELGTSLAPVLREQARALRAHQAALAEKKAAVAPLKLLIPLLLFIFPTIFIVLLGPLLLRVRQGGPL